MTRGSTSIEAVIIIPAFVVFLALIIAIARMATAQADIHAGLVHGVRIAGSQSSAADGAEALRIAVNAHLAEEGVSCDSITIEVDTAALDLVAGQNGAIGASLTCVVRLADLSVPGLPGSVTIAESFSTPIDAYSLRGP